jgi:lauroyl/myristoyl acyltransferase
VAAAINRAMEALIRQCPAQYLWSYPRYKNPVPSAAVLEPVVGGTPGDARV